MASSLCESRGVPGSPGGSGRLVYKGFHYGVPSQPGSLFQHFSDALFEPPRRLDVTGIELVVQPRNEFSQAPPTLHADKSSSGTIFATPLSRNLRSTKLTNCGLV